MKNTIHKTALIFLLAFLSSFSLIAQVPEGIVYQAEARDSNGKILQNQYLDVEVNILRQGKEITLEATVGVRPALKRSSDRRG